MAALRVLGALAWLGLGLGVALPSLATAEEARITTRATARERLASTVADVEVGIEAAGRTQTEVQAALGAGSQRLLSHLRAAGLERLRTGVISIQPRLEAPARGGEPRIAGYQGHVTVLFQTESARLGEVLDAALANGANAVERTLLHPRDSEVEAARARLVAQAARRAVAEAKSVAEAVGRAAGPVLSLAVDEQGPAPGAVAMARSVAVPMAAMPGIATEAGDTEVSAHVVAVTALAAP